MMEELYTPEEYICPISLSVMKDPVMSKDGKNFEKRAILDWLTRGNVNCPLTRLPLKPSLLVPNASLKLSIDKWKKENGVDETEHDDNDDNDDDSSIWGANDCTFVGLLQLDANVGSKNDDILSSPRHDTENPVIDDDLRDLMDLYNEVLELTSAPFQSHSHLPSRSHQEEHQPVTATPIVPSDEEVDAAIGVMVAHTARRMWRPKLFKKTSTATSHS